VIVILLLHIHATYNMNSIELSIVASCTLSKRVHGLRDWGHANLLLLVTDD